ncbi:MAG: PQQ-binding-like beta-propeller repeat protein, partial [bacterium]|nr:PQQ-binding-like beta-propeller repeat protein [bacterium]
MKPHIPSDLWWKCWTVLLAMTSPVIGQTTIEDYLPLGPAPQQVLFELDGGPGEAAERATVQLAPGTSSVSVATVHEAGLVVRQIVQKQGPDSAPLCALDWNNFGGNHGRFGLSSEVGPSMESPLWSGGRPSIIAWLPVIEGNRMFTVRQLAFPSGEPDASPIVATELDTGAELWFRHLQFNPGDWTTWIAGARDGRVYASRSGNGASVSASLHALDAATGATVWMSADEIDAGARDGVVFAPNGDLIVASFQNVMRIRADDGTTLWNSPRTCSVTSSCGAVIHGDAVYVADAAVGGHEIVRYDLATGAMMYASSTMSGFTLQNTPTAGPDGTIYLSRTQNNPATDFFYAFEDTGSAFVDKWNVPAAWTTFSMFA